MTTTWLDRLAAGDRVIVSNGWSYTDERIVKVDRVTATQVIVGTQRYRKSDGVLSGPFKYDRERLLEPTPENMAKVVRQHRIKRLERIVWTSLPDETLCEIIAAIDATTSTQAPAAPGCKYFRDRDVCT